MPTNCEHKEWMGLPVGHQPTHWQCVDCGLKMTAGEFFLYSELQDVKKMVSKVGCVYRPAD